MSQIKLNIGTLDDRLTVAQILVKSGYKVHLSKEKKTGKGNQYNYFVVAEKIGDGNAG